MSGLSWEFHKSLSVISYTVANWHAAATTHEQQYQTPVSNHHTEHAENISNSSFCRVRPILKVSAKLVHLLFRNAASKRQRN